MAAKGESGNFRLQIPLDASGIKDFKPDRAVKVVAFDAKGHTYQDVVKLDAKGKGVASLAFKALPGSVRVAVGPENASAEQMKGLQTINVDVARRQWGDKKELTIDAVLISAYYWWWWLWWCRDFKITGRVLCADGSPVPGAQVCAYDVDWWWWWWSNQQVGCATTDVNGAFEIDFTWCCGWWPWWWWARRTWLLEPTLAERISRLLREEVKLTRIPTPGPQPDPAVFRALLGEPGVAAPRSRRLLASHTQAAGQAVRAGSIDPGSLESLRTQLVAKLPAVQEFERLRLWPWWPWWPWWDCDPDIIFKVVQNCHGQDRVIVDETIWDARWDVPTNLNVTLVANDQACCITQGSTCLDGGECAFISDICEDNIGNIGGNPGALAAPIGFLNPGLVDIGGDRPYSGTVPLRGCVGTAVDYYEFLFSTAGFGGPWNPLPVAADGGFTRSYWDNGLKKWIDVPFPFTSISDGVTNHNVIESLPHYETNNGAKLWDAFTVDLLMELVTQNVLADGTYYLRMQGWTRAGYAGNLANAQILPVCGSQDLTGVVVTIDNHLVTAGPTDLNGHPCGAGTVHQCTTEPDTQVVSVQILHSDNTTTDVGACGNVTINDTDMLIIDFVAYDPDPQPHFGYYTLALNYDVNLTTNLLDPSLSGWSLTPSPIPPIWAPPAAQVGPNYGDPNPVLSALSQGAVSPIWAGGAMRLTVKAKSDANHKGAFPYTCCYQLQLYAHKRTIGGGGASCDHSFWNQWNVTEYSFTINV
jgi:hypothetical protein